jgi:SnoaL-like polyketide cyclase
MSQVSSQVVTPETVTLGVLTHLGSGQFREASACFAEEFRFTDHGIGLEFKDKARLTEFFCKVRELYPDSLLITNRVFPVGDHVVLEWTYRATVTEPFCGGYSMEIPVSMQGTSIVRTREDEITDWTDYYDGLTSRRTALASHFQECVES